MTLPLIVNPLPIAAIAQTVGTGAGLDNLATPNPKEAFVASGAGQVTIAIDFGVHVVIDTVFLGFTNLPEGASIDLLGDDAPIGSAVGSHSYRRAPARHAFVAFDAPIGLTSLQLRVPGFDQALVAGIVAAGLGVRASAGVEPDWGRPITDTSVVSRLPGGSFGIDRAAASGGYQWTMPALTDIERDQLYALQLDVGIGSTILAIEDPAAVLGRNEVAHWSLITKPDVFARTMPGESKWPWQVQDWA